MNLTSLSRASMRTSVPMLVTPADVFTSGGVRQSTPQSAVIVTTPPVFAGITGVTPKTDGSINVQWAAATSTNAPHEYQVYIAPGSVNAATLFALPAAVLADNSKTNIDVMKLSDQTTYLVKGQTYTLGVRCKDGVGNQNTNLVIMTATAIASGNMATVFQAIADSLIATDLNLIDRNVELTAVSGDLSTENSNYGALNTAHGALNTALSGGVSALSNEVNDLSSEVASLGVIGSSIGGFSGTQMSMISVETTMTIDMDGVN